MRFCIALFVVAWIAAPSQEASAGSADCRPDEYIPDPECGLEPTCAPPSSHSWPKHTCDCWCKPGLYRDIESNQCVKSLKSCPLCHGGFECQTAEFEGFIVRLLLAGGTSGLAEFPAVRAKSLLASKF